MPLARRIQSLALGLQHAQISSQLNWHVSDNRSRRPCAREACSCDSVTSKSGVGNPGVWAFPVQVSLMLITSTTKLPAEVVVFSTLSACLGQSRLKNWSRLAAPVLGPRFFYFWRFPDFFVWSRSFTPSTLGSVKRPVLAKPELFVVLRP